MENNYKNFINKEDEKKKTIESVIFIAICALIVVFCYVFFNYSVKEVIVSGPSMERTLYNGDVLYLSVNKKPKINDIVVISGESEDEWIIKRVIGLAGDEIEIKGGYVYRNGEKLVDDYNQYGYTEAYSWEKRVLTNGEVFYLGDNRAVSKDSRNAYFQTCTEDQVVGVVSNFSLRIKKFSTFVFYKIKMPILNAFK